MGTGTPEFDNFTNKQAQMKYTEHEILYNKWVDEEKQRRLSERAAVQVNKPTRKIESSEFGHAKPNVAQGKMLKPEQSKVEDPREEKALRSMRLSEGEREFARITELDRIKDQALERHGKFDDIDDEIVGLQRRKPENLSKEEKGKLTVAQKVQKELAYVTQAMDLDP